MLPPFHSFLSLTFLICIILLFVPASPDPDTGQPRVFSSQFGELPSPTAHDYDYDRDYVEKTVDFVPSLRPRLFSAVVERSYNPLTRKHHYHSNKADIALHAQKGFQNEGSIGRIIPLYVVEKRPMLHQVCPQLVELFSLLHLSSGATLLTADYNEMAKLRDEGWRALTSIGYCVRSSHPGVCGAKRPLKHLVGVGKKGNDNFYTTDEEEFERANKQDALFRGTGNGTPLCYLW